SQSIEKEVLFSQQFWSQMGGSVHAHSQHGRGPSKWTQHLSTPDMADHRPELPGTEISSHS
ncbi:hypothetical protein CEXT_676501, partial [Caerostris extrusa]